MTTAKAGSKRKNKATSSKSKKAKTARKTAAKIDPRGRWTAELVEVDKLLKMGSPYNPRKISPKMMARLRRSMTTDGVLQNIVCNRRTGHIVGGHQRVEAAKAEGIRELPVLWIDVELDREKRINVTLNSVAGQFVESALASMLTDMDAAARDLVGFEPGEIERLTRVVDKDLATDDRGKDAADAALNKSIEAVFTVTPAVASDKKFTAALAQLSEEFNAPYRLRRGK